jgi:hypothetical protein
MKTSFQKQSFGGGYGINRHTGGASTLTTAIPAMKGVARHPGTNIMPGSPKTGAAKPARKK